MKLVGASKAFIQRPFLYTGIWYGVIGILADSSTYWCGISILALLSLLAE